MTQSIRPAPDLSKLDQLSTLTSASTPQVAGPVAPALPPKAKALSLDPITGTEITNLPTDSIFIDSADYKIKKKAHSGDIAEIGIPDGGATGEVLTKNSSTDGDASWQAAPGDSITASGGLQKVGSVISIQTSGVTASHLASNSVTNAKLGTGAVTSTKIADNQVTSNKILLQNNEGLRGLRSDISDISLLTINPTDEVELYGPSGFKLFTDAIPAVQAYAGYKFIGVNPGEVPADGQIIYFDIDGGGSYSFTFKTTPIDPTDIQIATGQGTGTADALATLANAYAVISGYGAGEYITSIVSDVLTLTVDPAFASGAASNDILQTGPSFDVDFVQKDHWSAFGQRARGGADVTYGAFDVGYSELKSVGVPTSDDSAARFIDVDTERLRAEAAESAAQATADAALPKAGGTMSGDIDMSGNKITDLGTPIAAQDAATKDYVDTAVAPASDSQTLLVTGFGASSDATLRLRKVGDIVFASIQSWSIGSFSGSPFDPVLLSGIIPVGFRPADYTPFPILITVNATPVVGLFWANTNGDVEYHGDLASSGFQPSDAIDANAVEVHWVNAAF